MTRQQCDSSSWLIVRIWEALHATQPRSGAQLAILLDLERDPVLCLLAYMAKQGTAQRVARGEYTRAGLRPDRILSRRIGPSDEGRERIAEDRRLRGRASRIALRERLLQLLAPDVDLTRREMNERLDGAENTLSAVLRELRTSGIVVSTRRGYRLAPMRA